MKNPYLYKKFKDMTQHSLNVHFCSACAKGDLETMQYLLLSPELEKQAQLDYGKNKGLSFACKNGHIEVIRYILIEQKMVEVDIHANEDEALYCAVSEGQLEVVKYLLESPELNEHANLKDNEYIIKSAFVGGHLNIVKYFFQDVKDDLNININSVFMIAYKKRYDDILEYLIFDRKIPMSVAIKSHLDYRGDSFSNQIETMFHKREEVAELNSELIKNETSDRKPFKL
jgi:ankyrin repeat protein